MNCNAMQALCLSAMRAHGATGGSPAYADLKPHLPSGFWDGRAGALSSRHTSAAGRICLPAVMQVVMPPFWQDAASGIVSG